MVVRAYNAFENHLKRHFSIFLVNFDTFQRVPKHPFNKSFLQHEFSKKPLFWWFVCRLTAQASREILEGCAYEQMH